VEDNWADTDFEAGELTNFTTSNDGEEQKEILWATRKQASLIQELLLMIKQKQTSRTRQFKRVENFPKKQC